MVRGDGIDNAGLLTVFLGEVPADDGVRPLFLLAQRLAHVMHQGPAPCQLHIQLQLRGHDPADVGRLPRVVQVVLAVARPELQLAQQLHDFHVDVWNPQFEEDLLGLLDHHLVQVLLDPLDHFLNAGRMDPPVRHEPLQGDLRNFSAQRIKPGDQHRLGCLIHHQINPRRSLERPDVPAFPPDDPPLHAVVGNRHHRDRGFRHVIPRDPLDGPGDDVLRLPVGNLLGFILNPLDHLGGFELDVALDLRQQGRFGFCGRHAGGVLERLRAFLNEVLRLGRLVDNLLLAKRDRFLLLLELGFAPVAVGNFSVQRLFLLQLPLLQPENLGTLSLDLLIQIGLGLHDHALGLNLGLPGSRHRLFLGRLDDLCRTLFSLTEARGNDLALNEPEHADPDGCTYCNRDDDDSYFYNCNGAHLPSCQGQRIRPSGHRGHARRRYTRSGR